MKTIIIILKAVLFWLTFLNIFLYIIGGAVSVAEAGIWWFLIVWTVSIFVLVHLCRIHISLKDMYVFSGARFFDKIFK